MSNTEQQPPSDAPLTTRWGETTSETFLDYGRYFVPAREQQHATIAALLPVTPEPLVVLDLCCGEGLLAGVILAQHPQSIVYGLDGSPLMLERARAALDSYGSRFQGRLFDLADHAWRVFETPVHAIVSSLAIHHLDAGEKQQLFRDLYRMLTPGGLIVIADVIAAADARGAALAADAWDEAVRTRALELDGSTAAFDAFTRLRWNMFRGLEPDDIDKPSRLFEQLQWLEQAGFAAVDVYLMQAGHAIFGGAKQG
jgi:tRNA (cmo5U34)-methyltransferase